MALRRGALRRSIAERGVKQCGKPRCTVATGGAYRCEAFRRVQSGRRCSPCRSASAGEPFVTAQPAAASHRAGGAALIARVLRWLDAVPYSLLAIPLRVAVATVFWNSAMTKLANWDTAVALFADEYKVPLVPPEILA